MMDAVVRVALEYRVRGHRGNARYAAALGAGTVAAVLYAHMDV
jgi:hypothetical protein